MTLTATWLVPAFQDLILGVAEVDGKASNPKIDDYLKMVGLPLAGDETPWCSGFANWCLDQAGIRGTHMPNARSFMGWGDPCDARVGAIAVLWRGTADGWQGHVAFLLGWSASTLYLLGGNQGDSVSVAGYSSQRLLGYRWPSGG